MGSELRGLQDFPGFLWLDLSIGAGGAQASCTGDKWDVTCDFFIPKGSWGHFRGFPLYYSGFLRVFKQTPRGMICEIIEAL